MPQLIAKTALPYAHKRMEAGDTFEASERDARVLIAIGKAALAPEEAPAVVEEAPAVEADTKARGTYKTRDLKAK